ncbi:MAG: DUF4169 family protein [Parvibaculaceae bacterium]
MSEIVNLKRHRKRIARAEKELEAQENRERFGRSKAESARAETEKDRAVRHLDGHKRDE